MQSEGLVSHLSQQQPTSQQQQPFSQIPLSVYRYCSDEPELEFSSSSRAEPSWGTLIFELKPSWTENFLTHFFPQVFIIRSPVSWFQSILWSFILTFVFLKVNNLIQMHNLVNFIIGNDRK
jgi:hypothetical protein